MSDLRTISDVAAQTGFTASALRFYEDAGLIDPVRSPSGYRLYDDRAIERLQFISRAKGLGLTLEEITELLVLWDGDRCAPVAGRLNELVASKLEDTQNRIAELIAFAGDLQRFQRALVHTGNHDGPCGGGCACITEPSTPGTATAVTLGSKPSVRVDGQPPIACTLEPSETTRRVTDWQELLARSEGPRVAVEHGVRLRFPADPVLAGKVAALAAAEQACCSFFTFDVHLDHRATELTVTGPAEAEPVITAIFGVPA